MTLEDKLLLLKDLCSRLPYAVIVQYGNIVDNIQYIEPDFGKICLAFPNNDYTVDIEDVKPYLRPMSSMTEEEKEELKNLFDAEYVTSGSICYLEGGTLVEYLSPIPYSFCSKIIDWLLKNHFDYRGLIPKGLAIEITKENNPYR